MFLKINANGELSLEESDDFKRFHIEGDVSAKTFAAISEDAEENCFWIDAEAVADLAGRSDTDAWYSQFWTMLEKAEPYGFSDLKGRRTKAHKE